MTTRYAIDREALRERLTTAGEPTYRVDQVWTALYTQRVPLEHATALPARLRERVGSEVPLALSPRGESTSSDGLTTKWLWAAGPDGAQVETVLMRSAKRASVCVSSQAGCAMGCTFCATGQSGFERHLDVGEIVEQVARAQHATTQRVTHVVFMGMGEPLANYDPVWSAIERLHDDFEISARRITVSTVGVVPGILRLATERLPVTLAVSLHAPDDELRSQLVPLDARYPIREVLDAAAEFAGARGRRVSFEYACIRGLNDTLAQADALARLLTAWPGVGGAHVNLIPLNPTIEFGGRAPEGIRIRAFADRLRAQGVNATIRRSRGSDIDAACGQLRARTAFERGGGPSARMAP